MRTTVEDRFWSKVQGGGVEECWIWKGGRNQSGYGMFGGLGAHRVAYTMLRGEIPEGLYIDHLCSNRPCVNPWHLEAVSARMNCARSHDRGRGTNAPRMNPLAVPADYKYHLPVFGRVAMKVAHMLADGQIEEITLPFMRTKLNDRQAIAAMSWLAHWGVVDESWKKYDPPLKPVGVQIVPDRPARAR